MPLTYHSWLHQCHPHSLSLHHRGRFQEHSGFYCHTGACTPLRASYSWFHLIGPDTEVCRHTQASCLHTSCREHIGTGLEGWINKIHKFVQFNSSSNKDKLYFYCTFFTFTFTVPLIRPIFANPSPHHTHGCTGHTPSHLYKVWIPRDISEVMKHLHPHDQCLKWGRKK